LSSSAAPVKLRSLTGAAEDDKYIPAVASTFMELSKLATWDGVASQPKKEPIQAPDGGVDKGSTQAKTPLSGGIGLSYTINLNLPATTEIEVFNAIFKSLRDNLLRS